jgi:hypothetical protein
MRDDAGPALLALREVFARPLSQVSTGTEEKALSEIVSELREQASAVKAELDARNPSSTRRFRVALEAFAGTFVLYALATAHFSQSGVGPVLAGLRASLTAMHLEGRKEKLAISQVKARPAYDFVRAQELLSQRAP